MTLLVLSACAPQQPTHNACVVSRESGFMGAGAPEEHIRVLQNAAPCEMATYVGRGMVQAGRISAPPAHGTATTRLSEGATVIAYTPARDYVGEDRFTVDMGPNFSETIVVQVMPATAP